MASADNGAAARADELSAIIGEIRERVRARHPSGSSALPLPDLMPLVHARDAAQAKAAAIGTVNPRPGGVANSIIQTLKRMVSRALDWHVREQVEFNEGVMGFMEAALRALEDNNRLLARLAFLEEEARRLRDAQSQLVESRREWEHKVAANEVQFLRGVADLQGAFQHRVTLMESSHRELMQAQHKDFTVAIEKATLDIQRRLWADLAEVKREYESLIHNELRVIRQRAMAQASLVGAAPPVAAMPAPGKAAPLFDALRFAERFRGSRDYVRANQQRHAGRFAGCGEVLDIGCGRGEFLELMKEAGIAARGIDLSEESVGLCRVRGLNAETADLFEYLAGLPDESLGGVFSAQVIEHLPPERIPEMLALVHAKLRKGGVAVIETPNPECLAIFATHFYLDPTHTRPIPPPLLLFYLEEQGFGGLEVERLSPAVESMPSIEGLPEDFRDAFFGGLDYAAIARKLG